MEGGDILCASQTHPSPIGVFLLARGLKDFLLHKIETHRPSKKGKHRHEHHHERCGGLHALLP